MMTDDRLTFTVVDENNNEVECEALFTFESNDTGKTYLVYTDNSLDEYGNTKVYASSYDPNDPAPHLEPIQSDAEWAAVEILLDELQSAALFADIH
ncbi:MAG: DUF1292 domain-containing protein [Anaerotignum sp.]|nr:DUF1292 domain-containing protein [Anaerotignum sp.]